MPNNLPALIPVRAQTEIEPSNGRSVPATAAARSSTPQTSSAMPPASPGLLIDRRALTFALRFVSRLASRAPIQALKKCLFADGFLVATDLDVSLRVRIPSTGDLGALVP